MFLVLAILNRMKQSLIAVLICISLVAKDAESPLRYSVAICASFEKGGFGYFGHFLFGSFTFGDNFLATCITDVSPPSEELNLSLRTVFTVCLIFL